MAAQDNNDSQQADGALARRFAWVFGALAVVLMGFVIWAGRDWRMALGVAQQAGKVTTEAYVKWGMWWAALVNAFLCGGLALTAKWWAGKKLERPGIESSPILKRECLWLVVVLAAAAGLRWARMDLSFYNDEAHTFRTYVAGKFRPNSDGQVAWKPVKWLDTFWLDKVGNNLMPCSVFGRLSYDAWRKFSHAPDGAVCETAVRLPQWIAGMLALVVLWLAARRMLDRPASWVALVLMALHPWAVRYSTEARAYGMLMLAVALCFYFLQRAFDDGRWRWWLGLGLAEFLCVWSFSGVVFYLVVLNTGILTRMVYLWSKGGEGVMVLRPVVGMAVGGMVALQLMLPTLPQLIEAMNLDSLKGSMGRVWWADVMGGLLWGVRGWDSDPENPFNLALVRMLIHQPALWVVLVIEVALIIVGFVVLVKKSGVGRILAFAGPVGLLLSWLVMTTRGKYLHPWYVIYVIPNIIMFLVVGYKTITNINYLKNTFKWTMILIIFVIGGSWVWNDLLYVHRGKENLRGLVEVAHQFEFINGRKTGIYAAMLSDTDIYDSSVYVLKSTSEIDEVVIRARREEVPLLVSIGHQGIGDAASALQKLNKSEEFEMVATVWGLDEQQFTHYIYKLRSNK